MSLVNRGRFSVLKEQMVTNKLLFLFNALTFYSTNSFSDEVERKFGLNFSKSPIFERAEEEVGDHGWQGELP